MKDPVCGMSVTEESKHSAKHQGQRYHFCSETCLHKFKRAPQQYLQEEVIHNHVCCGSGHQHTQAAAAPVTAVDEAAIYTCPMHPEVEQQGPGSCPKCGMALELKDIPLTNTKTEYTCPMHPEIVQDHPGSCPKCGMALEAVTVDATEDTTELDDMTRRLWVSAILAIPIFFSAMLSEMWPATVDAFIAPVMRQWAELLLSAPVVWWGGWVFFQRGWQSIVTRHLNMFTLIAIGVGIAWIYSLIAVLLPGIFPAAALTEAGVVPVYFEAAVVITALVLLGQVMELRARSQTNAAIKQPSNCCWV